MYNFIISQKFKENSLSKIYSILSIINVIYIKNLAKNDK